MSALKEKIYNNSATLQNLAPEKFATETIRAFEAGDLIFAEGDDSREMFVVVEGSVEIFKATARGEVKLARLERGEFLGEMSLLESLPRSASVRALTHVKLLAIQPGGFLLKIRRDPTFAFEIMQSLSRRIRVTNNSLMQAVTSGETSVDKIKSIMSGGEFSSAKDDSK